MNIVVKSALASAALAFACATPVEIDDVQIVDPNAFGDAGPLGGAGGGTGQSGASQGGTGAGLGGTASGTGGAGAAGISGMPVGSSGSGGLPVAGAGGSGAGAGGTAGGSGGAAGAAAGAGGAAGTAGTGGTGSAAVFDPSSCDFVETAGCDTLTCQTACPPNNGTYCLDSCVAIVDCVTDQVAEDPEASCVTAADPLCGRRDGAQTSACTTLVESAGGINPTGANQPSFVAREFIECICSVPRP
jgi:hypothetical protein